MNENRSQGIILVTVRLVAALLAVGIGILAMRWLIVGQEWNGVSVDSAGSHLQISYEPYPPAAMYLVTALLVLAGVAKSRWLPVAWIGWTVLTVWSVLFLFSSGAAFIPADAVLLILLTILQTRRILYAWGGVFVLLALSIWLNYPLATAFLLAAMILLLVLTMVQWLPRIKTIHGQ